MAWTRYFPNVHKVAETHVACFLRRVLKNDDVLTYWHVGTRNWLVAIRLDKWGERGLYEFHTLNKDADRTNGPLLTPADIGTMTQRMFRPDDMSQVMEDAIAAENERLVKEQEFYEEGLAQRQAFARRQPHKVRNMMDAAWCGTMLTPRR